MPLSRALSAALARARGALLAVAAVLAAWQLLTVVTGVIEPTRFPTPSEVGLAWQQIAIEGYSNARLHEHVLRSVLLVSMGFAVASSIGVALGLAMGANRAIHVVTEDAIQPLTAARAMLKLIDKEQPGIVILGKQAIDDDCNQTGQMLAALWDRPQATFASKIEISDSVARVTREVDAGLETIEVDLPAVITTDLRLNEPRFIKLPDIMKAKSKPLETIAFADLGVESADHLKTIRHEAPAKRSKGVMVKDVGELVAALRAKGLV